MRSKSSSIMFLHKAAADLHVRLAHFPALCQHCILHCCTYFLLKLNAWSPTLCRDSKASVNTDDIDEEDFALWGGKNGRPPPAHLSLMRATGVLGPATGKSLHPPPLPLLRPTPPAPLQRQCSDHHQVVCNSCMCILDGRKVQSLCDIHHSCSDALRNYAYSHHCAASCLYAFLGPGHTSLMTLQTCRPHFFTVCPARNVFLPQGSGS